MIHADTDQWLCHGDSLPQALRSCCRKARWLNRNDQLPMTNYQWMLLDAVDPARNTQHPTPSLSALRPMALASRIGNWERRYAAAPKPMPTTIQSFPDLLAFLAKHTDYEKQQGGRTRDEFDLERMNEVLNYPVLYVNKPECICSCISYCRMSKVLVLQYQGNADSA
jgi:hypothetical protein